MTLLTEPTRIVLAKGYSLPDDADAVAYIAAVEAADGQALETATRMAINSFVKGCKTDGIWPAIKASCILAGARTRLGALTPLVGTAPTSFNFVDGDYSRKTGLVGDGSTKYLDSNRAGNADPQDNFHISVFTSAPGTGGYYMGSNVLVSGSSMILNDTVNTRERWNNRSNAADQLTSNTHASTGLKASTRNNGSTFSVRTNGATVTPTLIGAGSLSSFASQSAQIYVFARNGTGGTPGAFLSNTGRIAFYSIGESLDLALLDARVTDLINAFAAAIP